MRKILLIITLCYLVHALIPISLTKIDSYTPYKTLPNADSYDNAAYFADQTKVIFYKNDKNTVDIYRTVDYSIISKGDTTVKTSTATAIQFFTNSKGEQSYLIAQKAENKLYQINLDNLAEDPIFLAKFDYPIIKIEVSSSKKYYAIMFEDKTEIFTGELDKAETSQYSYPLNVKINSIRWHPKYELLAIAGGRDSVMSRKLLLMDVKSKASIDYSDSVEDVVQDVQFSSDGEKFAYIIKKSDDADNAGNAEQLVYILDQDTRDTSTLIANGATQLTSMKRQSQILTAFDGTYIYAWIFDQDKFEKKVNLLNGGSVSPDGADFIALNADSKSFVVYKLCPEIGTFYSNLQQICQPCNQPCKTCFSSEDHCSSCPDQYFFSPADFTCKACIDNCQTCTDDTTCSTCIDTFFYQQSKCNLCGDSILGCSLCKSRDVCDQCDSSMHWTNNTDKKCSCSSRYIQVNKICESCSLGCYICTAVNNCKTCDIIQHRSIMPVQGKCVCQREYFEDDNKECKACIRGCNKCDSTTTCLECDSASHWVPSGKVCTCGSGYYLDDSKICITCNVMQACLTCTSNNICTSCAADYVVNSNNVCEKEEEPVNLLVVILIGSVALIGLAAGAYFIFKLIKKRKMKAQNSLMDGESLEETQ